MSKKRHTAADEPFFLVRTMRVAVPDGHAIPPHAHDWHQLIYAAAGIMTVTADRGTWVVPPHWAIWAPARVAHAIRFSGASEFATLYLRPDRDAGVPAASGVVTVSPLLRELIARACEERMLDERDPIHTAISRLIRDALQTQAAEPLALPMPVGPELRRIADHCRGAGEDEPGPAIARRFGMGARTLERRFAAETGMTFGQWRRHARLLQALRSLASGAPVKAVAHEAGYRSASAFIAAFNAAFGTSPGRYFAGS